MTLFVFVRYDQFLLPRGGLSFQGTFTATLHEVGLLIFFIYGFQKTKESVFF